MRECEWRIDADDVDTARPGFTADEWWNGFAVVYVTAETLTTFATDNGGTVTVTDDGTIIVSWPTDWGADDDTFARADDGLYSLEGWCVELEHRHTYRADLNTHWCAECDTVTDYCTQNNPI